MGSCIEALLIEDNCSDAQLVETVVGLSTIAQLPRFRHVDRFETAISMLKKTLFDIVLLNLHLPDGQGTSLIRRLKEIAPQTPIVVLTGVRDEDMEAVALREGADDYLIKSHTFCPQRMAEMGCTDVGNALVERLHQVIEQARLTTSLKTTEAPPDNLKACPQLQLTEAASDRTESSYAHFSAPSSSFQPSPLQPSASQLSPTEYFVQTTLYSVGITLMSTLGLVHLEEGRYAQAESLLTGALEIRKRLLSPTHPDVIVSLHHLATLYDNQGKYIEAESLFYEALKLCEDVFGTNSAITRKFRNHALVISRLNQSLDRLD
ncbi:MAG: tetratricopeptide repeat protein [Cyanobacteria bacterium P01_D01_bin.105]